MQRFRESDDQRGAYIGITQKFDILNRAITRIDQYRMIILELDDKSPLYKTIVKFNNNVFDAMSGSRCTVFTNNRYPIVILSQLEEDFSAMETRLAKDITDKKANMMLALHQEPVVPERSSKCVLL